MTLSSFSFVFFFNDTATTEIYTLSLHDALPICLRCAVDHHGCTELGKCVERRDHGRLAEWRAGDGKADRRRINALPQLSARSEEHTSELQSPDHLVCRLLLEKKKKSRRILHSRY